MRNRAEKNDTNLSQDADINSKQNCSRECTVIAFSVRIRFGYGKYMHTAPTSDRKEEEILREKKGR